MSKTRALYITEVVRRLDRSSRKKGKRKIDIYIYICTASFMARRADGALESANHKDDG